ncbi:MAG: N-acetylmuramoyl-L-alanine amidase [Xanthomonadaceae bacterium]|nr:N-acetylmuramoyl-L-alanine amidase [Xanthomonadaceae bacterium]
MNDTTRPPSILPDNPDHRHHALYRHVAQGVATAMPERTAEQQANLTAGLVDAYLQSRPERERNLRLDESAIRDLRVVPGAPGAATPSLFLVSGTQTPNDATPRISTPLSTADVPARETLAGHAQQRTVGADGFLTDPGIVRTRVPGLERAEMPDVNGIVMHRTMGSTADGTLGHWRGQDRPSGTHFLIDRDGTIHQTASLDQHTNHVGRIRSRGEEEGTLTPEQTRELAAARRAPGSDVAAVHDLEVRRGYPDRYPTNRDSIGIEVVATYDERTRTWQEPTEAQRASIQRLVGTLQNNFGLNDRDVYEHDRISYKTQGEGAGLYRPAAVRDADAPGVQQPAGPPR